MVIWSLWKFYIPILLLKEEHFKEKIEALSPFWNFGFITNFQIFRWKLLILKTLFFRFFSFWIIFICIKQIFNGASKKNFVHCHHPNHSWHFSSWNREWSHSSPEPWSWFFHNLDWSLHVLNHLKIDENC